MVLHNIKMLGFFIVIRMSQSVIELLEQTHWFLAAESLHKVKGHTKG